MKGKKSLILASIFAGIGLVGATFATWAVTDNASPFGFKISPGQIQDDTGIELVTLSVGERTTVNVSGLAAGQYRNAGTAVLKADTSKNSTYTGKLELSFDDQTKGKAEGDAKLLTYLKVHVYKGEVTAAAGVVNPDNLVPANLVGTLVGNGYTAAQDFPIEIAYDNVGEKQEQLVTFVVELLSTAQEKISEIQSDVVYLKADWKNGETDVTDATPIYYKHTPGTGNKVYCYAWGNGSQNAEFPGLEMTKYQDGMYLYSLKSTYTKVIFVDIDGDGNEVTDTKTADIDVTEAARTTTPVYDNGTWKAISTETIDVNKYYVVGLFTNWEMKTGNYLTQVGETSEYTAVVTLPADKLAIKVCKGDGVYWYGVDHVYDGCGYTVDGDGNAVAPAAGTYTVHFYADSADGNFIKLVAA